MRVPSGTARLLVEARLDDGNMLAFPRDRMLPTHVDKFVQNSLPVYLFVFFCNEKNFLTWSHLVDGVICRARKTEEQF